MEGSSIGLLLLIVAVVILFRLKIKHKKSKEYAFLKSIDYSTRIPEVKSKPKNGKRRTREEVIADRMAYEKLLGIKFRKNAKAEQIKAMRVGSKYYIWHGSDCCPECDKQDGKKFKWSSPPKTGHPGEGKLCPNGYCRCWAESQIH